MKRTSEIQKIKDKFYWEKGIPNLDSYGVYRIGLLNTEIDDYLRARAGTIKITKLRNKFDDIAGCNTMGVSPDGKGLMYRHDVLRFADKLFNGTPTYWD